MTEQRVLWHLENWMEWMETGQRAQFRVRLSSAEGKHESGRNVDDQTEAMDRVSARATNAVISDLAPVLRQCIYSKYLGHRWPYSAKLNECFALALPLIGAGLDRKHIL